jgi:hypothetical protein
VRLELEVRLCRDHEVPLRAFKQFNQLGRASYNVPRSDRSPERSIHLALMRNSRRGAHAAPNLDMLAGDVESVRQSVIQPARCKTCAMFRLGGRSTDSSGLEVVRTGHDGKFRSVNLSTYPTAGRIRAWA